MGELRAKGRAAMEPKVSLWREGWVRLGVGWERRAANARSGNR